MSGAAQERIWGDFRGHEAKECDHCQQWFFPPFERAVICYPCWKRSQAAGNEVEALRKRISALKRELVEAGNEVEALRKRISALKRELVEVHREYGTEIYELRRELRQLGGKPKVESIPGDMLRRLLHLSHPDKHAGSEAATIATRWLLEQRESRHG